MRLILLTVKPVGASRLRADIVYQNPVVSRALPFTASNGVALRTLPSGRPAAGLVKGVPTVFLRGEECPLQNWNDPITGEFPDAALAAEKIKAALKEFRTVMNMKGR